MTTILYQNQSEFENIFENFKISNQHLSCEREKMNIDVSERETKKQITKETNTKQLRNKQTT